MAVSREEVLRIAALARLEVDPAEVDSMTAQLNRILEQVGALPPAASGEAGEVRPGDPGGDEAAPDGRPAGSALRPDEPGPDPLAIPPAAMAPAWVDGFFTVPRLASHDSAGEAAAGGEAGAGAGDAPAPGAGPAHPGR